MQLDLKKEIRRTEDLIYNGEPLKAAKNLVHICKEAAPELKKEALGILALQLEYDAGELTYDKFKVERNRIAWKIPSIIDQLEEYVKNGNKINAKKLSEVRLSFEVEAILKQSKKIAKGLSKADQSHFLAALYESKNQFLYKIIDALDAPVNLEFEIKKQSWISRILTTGEVAFDSEMEESIQQAHIEAYQLESRYVEVEHMLLAILGEGQNTKAKTFWKSRESPTP